MGAATGSRVACFRTSPNSEDSESCTALSKVVDVDRSQNLAACESVVAAAAAAGQVMLVGWSFDELKSSFGIKSVVTALLDLLISTLSLLLLLSDSSLDIATALPTTDLNLLRLSLLFSEGGGLNKSERSLELAALLSLDADRTGPEGKHACS